MSSRNAERIAERRRAVAMLQAAQARHEKRFAYDAAELAPATLAELEAVFPDMGRGFWEGTLLGGTVRPCASRDAAALLLA